MMAQWMINLYGGVSLILAAGNLTGALLWNQLNGLFLKWNAPR